MIAAIQDPNPVVFIDERLLYGHVEPVPEEIYQVAIGKGCIRREGKDVTVVAVSLMVHEAMKAADISFSSENRPTGCCRCRLAIIWRFGGDNRLDSGIGL
jgi:pyruvate/2-oxoglutarate/acetoin dehydrogenase E1 component